VQQPRQQGRLGAAAGERVEVGDVEPVAGTMIQERPPDDHRLAAATQRRLERLVAGTISAQRPHGLAREEIDNWHNLHGWTG
jgi:hypothetical protein